jgi:hypothetical protein
VIWLTPAGTEDEGGVPQPAYLNFDTTLLGPPHGNEMQARARPDVTTVLHSGMSATDCLCVAMFLPFPSLNIVPEGVATAISLAQRDSSLGPGGTEQVPCRDYGNDLF